MSNPSGSRSLGTLTLAFALLATLSACSGESSPGGEGSGASDGAGASGGSGGSGGSGASSATDLPAPCTLVTPAELAAIVDVTLARSAELRGLTGDPSCTWYGADDIAVFQLSLWDDAIQYDYSKQDDDSVPLSGIGVEAHLGFGYTVHVLTATGAFFAQSLSPVTDGQVSPEIQSAISPAMQPEVLQYEAAFRLAQLVIDEL